RAARCGNRVENMGTLGACLERLLDSVNLSAYPADTIQQLVLVSKHVCYRSLAPLFRDSIPRQVFCQAHIWLLDCYDHRVGSNQMLDTRFAEAGFFHPALAVCSGVVEASRCFDQHVEAHKQAKDVL